jgi:hypothetical protein
MTKVQVHVTHRAGVFESTANHAITRSLTAPTLAALPQTCHSRSDAGSAVLMSRLQ